MAIAFMAFLREAGWCFDDEDANEAGIGPTVPFWRGPGRCEPVYWRAQFNGLYGEQGKGDRSDCASVWTQGISMDFRFSDPGLFEKVVEFLREVEEVAEEHQPFQRGNRGNEQDTGQCP